MSNVLKVALQETIRSLEKKGWSQRRIARELGVNRRTVGKYARAAVGVDPKCTTQVTAGLGEEVSSKCTTLEREVTAGKSWDARSLCAPWAEVIFTKLEEGQSAQRIYQDLRDDHQFGGSYESVKRFVGKLRVKHPDRVWRLESQPGEEMQVDFGLGAPIVETPGGRSRRSWVFRVVLSHSRKGYSEAVYRQDTETFLRCLENALRSFGGVPQLLNLDNLKAAVLKADWFDPEINPKLADFCRHYGMHVVPCRPRTPQHKGKVERGVAYVRYNALKGRRFGSLAEQNRFLSQWEASIADKRIHGTTRKQVAACFDAERPHLQPLPMALFPCYQEARRSVHRDGYVEVAKAYYQAPPEMIARQVWVRWDHRNVRIFNDRMEQIALHVRIEPGQFSRSLGTGGHSAPVASACRYWSNRAALLGDQCGAWATAALKSRGPEALRSIMGLCNLMRKHSASAIDTACGKALHSGTLRLKDIQRLLTSDHQQSDFAFHEHHPLIRNLKTYSDFIHQQPQPSPSNHAPYPPTTRPYPTPHRPA